MRLMDLKNCFQVSNTCIMVIMMVMMVIIMVVPW
jgi:hypothetical protein